MPWAHNLFLELLAERGVFGLAAFLLLMTNLLLALRRMLGSVAHGDPLLEATYLSTGLVAVAGVFELSLLRLWLVVIFFVLVGIVLAKQNGEGADVEYQMHQRA